MYQVDFSSKYVMHILQDDDVDKAADEATPSPKKPADEATASEASATADANDTPSPTLQIQRRKRLRKPARRQQVTEPASATASEASATADANEDSSTAEEVTVDSRLLQSDEVQALEEESEYQSLKAQTVKQRKAAKKQTKFHTMRSAIRRSAKAAREAYILGRESQPDTPDVQEMLQVNAHMYIHHPI